MLLTSISDQIRLEDIAKMVAHLVDHTEKSQLHFHTFLQAIVSHNSYIQSRYSTTVTFKIMLPISTVQDGVTGLSMASQNGHEEVVRVLLQSGAKDTPNKVSVTFVV